MATHSIYSRRISQCAVIEAFANFGPVSRARVAKITGLSKQTVSEIVANLEAEGWLRTVGQTAGHVGRRAVNYVICPNAATVASVDLGGTRIRVAVCDLTGNVLASRVEPTERRGGTCLVDQIARMVRGTAARLPGHFGSLRNAVVGVPGVPDPGSGIIQLARRTLPGSAKSTLPDCSAWRNAETFERRPLFVENDVNLAAARRALAGKPRRGRQPLVLHLGSELASAPGSSFAGPCCAAVSAAAGEIGYLPFGADPGPVRRREPKERRARKGGGDERDN